MDADDRLTTALADDLDAAFDALVVTHQDRLYTIALRMLGDARDAEEAAQDALVRAYRRWLRTTPNGSASSAARLADDDRPQPMSIGRRSAAARGPRPVSIEGDASRPAADLEAPMRPTPSEVAERHAERERWAARLTALPPAYRAAIVLRHVDGMSYPEAAAALGRPEGTVKAQVHRGIALLRTMLEAEARRELEEMTA